MLGIILTPFRWLHRGLKRCLDARTPGCAGCQRLGFECADCREYRQC